MPKSAFLPVILGSDHNAYGMARSFHEQYGIQSVAVGKGQLAPTRDSKIIHVHVIPQFTDPEVFTDTLLKLAPQFKEQAEQLILIASNENYAELVIRNRSALQEHYLMPFVDEALMDRLVWKEKFYELCEQHQLDYPQTVICHKEGHNELHIDLHFPVVIKPADSMLYFDTVFKGKKKAYIAHTEDEARQIIQTIYASTYDYKLIIQEYIPGDATTMRVLNCYVGQDHRVKMMCLGRILLEDCTPALIGNYAAIINEYDEQLYHTYRTFLEALNYTGFANIDLKYDERDGKFKVFEVNIRQGRSSYFTTGSGYNLAKYVVDDLIYNKPHQLELANTEHLWLGVPKKLLFQYVQNAELKQYAKKLIKEKKYSATLDYAYDFNLKRWYRQKVYEYDYVKRFQTYFRPTGMS